MEIINKEYIVLGSGPAGLMFILASKANKKITLIEKPSKNNTLGKRILVSGNGRANFFNEDLLNPNYFKDQKLIDIFYKENNYPKECLDYLIHDLNTSYYKEDKLYYPYFNKSECFHLPLVSKVKDKVKDIIYGSAKKIDRKKHLLYLFIDGKEKIYHFEKLIIATGGRSYDRDDFSYELLDSLEVNYKRFESALAPIIVKEKIPSYLTGFRLKGKVELFKEDNLIHQEEGEILFKEDGLSGIVIFNTTLEILKNGKENNYSIKIDYSSLNGSLSDNLDCYPTPLREYLKDNNIKAKEKLSFTFKAIYPFKYSQVSYGGVTLDEINNDTFSLLKDDKIIVIGEVLDIACKCGGYNMGLALIEGYKAGKNDK